MGTHQGHTSWLVSAATVADCPVDPGRQLGSWMASVGRMAFP